MPPRVEVVSDDRGMIRGVAQVATRFGANVFVASDAVAARALARLHTFAFRVVDDPVHWVSTGTTWAARGDACEGCSLMELALCAARNVVALHSTFRVAPGSDRDGWAVQRFARADFPKLLEELEGRLRSRHHETDAVSTILGNSPAMETVRERIRAVATFHHINVLVLGETGTGKELVAQAIHHAGRRAAAPFVAINCAAIPEALFETELFGHEAGAYTGARGSRKGLLEAVGSGTLFLDEVGDMPARLQPKLLRALETRSFRRVGGTHDLPLTAGVVSATNRPGLLRSDLFYRLAGFVVSLPPLRERPEDITLLANTFLRSFTDAHTVAPKYLSEGALEALRSHRWPGNVRELRAAIEYAAIVATERVIGATEVTQAIHRLPTRYASSSPPGTEAIARAETPTPPSGFRDMERELLLRALKEAGGNRSRAAERLQLPRSTFRNKLAKYGIR